MKHDPTYSPGYVCDLIVALKSRLRINQGRLAFLLGIPDSQMSLYANASPLRRPTAVEMMKMEQQLDHPEWDENLLSNLPPEERIFRKGRSDKGTRGRRRNPPIISTAEIETFMRRWNINKARLSVLTNSALGAVYDWLKDKTNAHAFAAERIRNFQGDTGPLWNNWRSPDVTNVIHLKRYRLAEYPAYGTAMCAVWDFHQPALVQALKESADPDPILDAVCASWKAAHYLQYSEHNEDRKQAFWTARLAAEKLIEPALLAEGWNADYSAPQF